MPKTKTKIITYSLLAITSALAFYFVFKTKQLNGKLKQVNEKMLAMESTNFFNQPLPLEATDSLLLNGRYAEALSGYQKYANQTDHIQFSRALRIRIELARQLIDKSRERAKEEDTSLNTDVNLNRPYATPEEVRQFDSLNFALDKANMRIRSLEVQLQEDTTYSYLTFKTSKGIQAHYVGQVKYEKARGNGVALLSTGSRYEGEWKNNLRHGQGAFYWPDGQYYVGTYKDDRRHGLGTYHWTNGEKFVGYWENDRRNGEGTFYGEEGEIVAKGTWKDDELVEVEE